MPNLNSSQENKSHITPSRGIHSKSKHTYHNVFGDANIQYHDFDNGNALTFTDKYTTLLQQELQNPYWCLHDPITTKSYQISSEMDTETMPHAMYFFGDKVTITKINQVPYQVIDYDDKGMFIPCHTIVGKGIAYVKPFDLTLPLRPVEIEFENNMLFRGL